jgi:hypothetical protein
LGALRVFFCPSATQFEFMFPAADADHRTSRVISRSEVHSAPATALASRSGFRQAFTVKTGGEAVIGKTTAAEKRADVSVAFERAEHYARSSSIGASRLLASKPCTGTKSAVRLYCSKAFVNAIGSTAQRTFGRRIR